MNDITRTLSLLFAPGQVVEVRAITEEGMASGYFDDLEALVRAVQPLDDLPGVHGVYVTLNEVEVALLSRRANRIKTRLAKKDATTADADILRRRWFPIDIDPVRPSGVSSTDEEHGAAVEKARGVAAWLAGEGWPPGILASSGNGAHLLYRVDLPNDDASRELLKRGLEVLAALFDDDRSTVDPANHNAARIWKLYGTMTRKGDHTPGRPHRRSRLLDVPDTIAVVPTDLLVRLASVLPSAPGRGNGPGTPFDLSGWLRDHGIGVSREKPWQGGTLYVLDDCPFGGDHRDGAFAVQFANGAVHAGCHHASCGGGSQRWQELRAMHETPGEVKRPAIGRPPPNLPPAPAADEIPNLAEALDILQSGDPRAFMLRTFSLDHEGDGVLAECLVLSLASRSVANTNGLHVSVTGESGKGKSHAFATLLSQVPERFRLKGAMSNKALFYIEEMRPGTVIVLDDATLSDDMQEILKGVTTSFRDPFLYRTVSKDRKGQVCTIPERCVWWVAKVEGSGDDQVFNRMLTCWIDDSTEQDARVLARVLSRDTRPPAEAGAARPEVITCRAMWELIGRQCIHVVIPYAAKIRFQESTNRRNPEMLLDLIKANAVLRHQQREKLPAPPGVVCIRATRDDFDQAARLYGLLNGTSGGQTTKLTKRESNLVTIIDQRNWPEFTISMLQKETGISNSAIYKTIHGYTSRGSVYSGLLEKCPAIAYTDRTVVTEEECGLYTRRRTNAYTFDRDLFRQWCAGGGVWIDENESPGGPDDEEGGGRNHSALSADFRNLSAPAEKEENEPSGRIQEIKSTNTHMCVSDPQSFRKSGITQCSDEAGECESHSLCDLQSAEKQITKSEYIAPIDEKGNEQALIAVKQLRNDAENCSNSTTTAENQPQIRAADYKPLDYPERTPCFVCGRSPTWFVEKLTAERRARPKDEQDARRICRKCYQEIKARDQEACRMLPGTVEVSRMQPVTAYVGKCSLCDLDTAAYRDAGTGVLLCERCYQREGVRERLGAEVGG